MIGDFHFLRPWWLLALLPSLLLAWAIHRRSAAAAPWKGIVADQLLPYLVRGRSTERRLGPLLLLLCGWVVSVIVLSGPSWKREPSPFADDVAAIAIVIKVTPSMDTEDIAPSRLARSVQKIHDFLAARGAAKAGLVAYAGSSHVVIPATVDAGVIESFAGSLSPGIMPEDGDAAAEALQMADQLLAGAGGGSILWIADDIAPEQQAAITRWRRSTRTPVRLLAPLPESPELTALRNAAGAAEAKVIQLSSGDEDISELARASKFASPAPGDEDAQWKDGGYWLTPLLALIILPFFRKGWMALIAARS